MYIWPYDDWFTCSESKERQLRLGETTSTSSLTISQKELVEAVLATFKESLDSYKDTALTS